MNLLDAVVVVGAVAAAAGGYRSGVLSRSASWIGLAGGFWLALRLVPAVLGAIEVRTSSARLLLVVALLVLGTFAGQALGLVVEHRLRGVVPAGPGRSVDRAAGAVAGVATVVLALWLFLPLLADVPGWPAEQARGSVVARAVNRSLPDAPDATRTVRRLVGAGGFPHVFGGLRPSPDAGRPPAESTLSPEAVARVSAATVKVVGEACRRVQEGSGFTVADDLVVTNAHVVAGERRPTVVRADGKRLPARVVLFDPGRDLAVLRIDRLGLPALPRHHAHAGTTGAVFGYPGGQDRVRPTPARISDRVTADGQDIYGHPTTRDVYILAAELLPGDSGGPVVDREGRVVGVAFAIAPDRAGTAYALTSSELEATLRALEERPSARAGPTACI